MANRRTTWKKYKKKARAKPNISPRATRKLHYDSIVNFYSKLALQNPSNPVPRHMLNTLTDAKLFWIDAMVLDSLMNEPCSWNALRFGEKFPFPTMFFEFEVNPPYEGLFEEFGSPKTLDGLCLDTILIPEGTKGVGIKAFSAKGDFFAIFSHSYLSGNSRITEYNTDIHGRTLLDTREFFLIDGKLFRGTPLLSDEERMQVYTNVMNDSPEDYFELEKLEFALQDDDSLNAFKLANLSMNLIDYINAQNVVLRKKGRKRKEVRRVGKGKHKQVEKRRVPLKPFYWVEVKKEEQEEAMASERSWTLDYRVWVRGHNRHYQDGKVTWIDPYVKGPPDAPWKNNRYEVLFERFKHILRNPRYREGPG